MVNIVIDNGSSLVKAGFSGDIEPYIVFSSIIGNPKYRQTIYSETSGLKNGIYIGDDAQMRRGILKITYPIINGIIKNWDNMIELWDYTFKQIDADPTNRNILLTEAPCNPLYNREKMVEIMFETFNVGGTFVALQGVLSLYASGRTTGIVLDIGDGVAHTMPIFDGFCIPNAVNRQNIAGKNVTNHLNTLLGYKNYRFTTSAELEIVKRIKEKLCYCAIDYEEEYKMYNRRNCTRTYTLPDGNKIYLDTEMFEACELLFSPNLIGSEAGGIHLSLHNAIQKADLDLRNQLYKNIVLSGGTTMIKNLDKRLYKELDILKPVNLKNIDIVTPSNRNYSVWLGGSVLSSLDSFRHSWITKEEYQEHGVNMIRMKSM